MNTSVDHSRMLAIAAACIALNLAVGKVANLLSLPVYLDTAGTITGAILLNPVLAILVGAATSLLGSVVINPVYAFYAGTQIVVAITAILAIKYGLFKTFWGAAITAVAIAVVAAIASAPVTVLVFGGVTVPGATAINAVLIAAGHNLWQAVITGSLIVEIADKLATTLTAWIIYQRLPFRVTGRVGS